jgi:sigma-B regulation protein RsbU (phosphoserine phosphatase)
MTVDWQTGVGDPARLAAVQRTARFGDGPEDAFDRLTELAAELIGVSRVCITLIDGEHTRAKSMIGFPADSPRLAPVAQTFCRFVVGSGQPLIVDDARRDSRTAGDPAIEIFDAAAWVGFPIVDDDGAVLGTFCLMDSSPHQWTPQDLYIIATLAKAASSEILLRLAHAEISALRRRLGIADDGRVLSVSVEAPPGVKSVTPACEIEE